MSKSLIERASDDTWISCFGFSYTPSFCKIVFVETKIGDSGKRGAFSLGGMLITSAAAMARYLAPLLRGVVLIREPALGLRLDQTTMTFSGSSSEHRLSRQLGSGRSASTITAVEVIRTRTSGTPASRIARIARAMSA